MPSITSFLSSYGFSQATTRRFEALSAVIAGSAALYLYCGSTHKFKPSDLDIFLHGTDTAASAAAALRAIGYVDELACEPNSLDDEDVTSYTSISAAILSVNTFIHPCMGKKVQLVALNMAPATYISNYADLSCVALYYTFSPGAKAKMTAATRHAIKAGVMCIMPTYSPVAAGIYGDAKQCLLLDRIEKYGARGFTLISHHDYVLSSLKSMPVSVPNGEEVPLNEVLCEGMRVIVTMPGSMKKRVCPRDKLIAACGGSYTPWGHKLASPEDAVDEIGYQGNSYFILSPAEDGEYEIKGCSLDAVAAAASNTMVVA